MEKLRVLAAGCLHGDVLLARRLAEMAEKENVDLVMLCGDLTYAEQGTQGMIGPFLKKGKKVVLIQGNHESVATVNFLAELYKIKNLHGSYLMLGEAGFFGCSGVNIGINQMTEREIYELLKKGHDYISHLPKKIMVTHVHPTGTIMEKFSKFVIGSEGVRKAVEAFQPDFLFCSHVHEAEGIEERIGKTRIINVGSRGTIIEV